MPNGMGNRLFVGNPYSGLGMCLTISGACLSPIFYLIVESIPLTGMAISFVMLGLVSITLANTRSAISPEASQMMLEAGMENIAVLLEELGLKGKAIYLPRSLRDGRAQALIPIMNDYSSIVIRNKIPGRLIVRYGRDPQDVGVAVSTPGSVCLDGLTVQPGRTSVEIESALSTIMVGMLDIASSVSVNIVDNLVNVKVSKPKLGYQNIWFLQSMGSPLASIAAATTSEALDKPVVVVQDEHHKGKAAIKLEVLT